MSSFATAGRFDPSSLCGWRNDGGHHVIAATLPTSPAICQGDGTEPSSNILLYKAWHDVLGHYPDYPAQQIGDCVSFGHGHANDLLQCIEICFGEPAEYRETDTEFLYGESRKLAGMLGFWDGSYGAAAVKAMLQVGTVSREMLGSDGTYSGQRAKSWGLHGPPTAVEAQAAPYKLGSVAKITTWDELVAALWNGSPVTICSNQGFTLERDSQGFCSPRGTWGHCMFIAGVRFDRKGALIVQSWGPTLPSGPLDLDQPSFSFWAERPVIESILAAGDSWALSRAAEFVKRPLPKGWFGS
ncbi:MAG: hypothetical protein JO293_01355 [Candidatus Eremiobacteraeota bacterium]|nr:hypothetical protein [Candidatus Eremiobacteraeota bacterium]